MVLMELNIFLANQEEKTIVLSENKDADKSIWTGIVDGYDGPDYKISILLDDNDIRVDRGNNIGTSENAIIEDFRSNLLEIKKSTVENEISGFEVTEDDDNDSKSNAELKPYDPELIRVETRSMSINYLYEMMVSKHGDLDLSPNFQRNFVWTDITRKSRLIESILLRIPLPVFYLSQDDNGALQVVDGVQRLSVIKSYLNNEFKLKNLEYLDDCEGCYFDSGSKSLNSKYIRRIQQTQLVCNVIDPQTPYKVKFDIFKRINTGGKPLNPQEIRNCLSSYEVRSLLNDLSTSTEFITATDRSISSIRMADQELIMRFIGFYYVNILNIDSNSLKYKGDMNQFLDDTLELLNREKPEIIDKIRNAFLNSMLIASYLFEKYAFRKCTTHHLHNNSRKQLINRSLFTSLSVVLSEYNINEIAHFALKGSLALPLAVELENNLWFFDAITYGTSDRKRIDATFIAVDKIITRSLKGQYDK
jgi:hypothetical protein